MTRNNIAITRNQIAAVHYVLASKSKAGIWSFLAPNDRMVPDPRDAGLWSEEKAIHLRKTHCPWRHVLTLDQALKFFRISLTRSKII